MKSNKIGKYELLEFLGNGAFGYVYLALDLGLNAKKAIKILNAPNVEDVMKKLEEAQILYKYPHKNIVKLNEANVCDIDSKLHVIIDMEYLPKGNFENAIKERRVSIHDTLDIIVDCLFALEYAHKNGILHRDVKPANIMLCDIGAKLSDFGLATVLGIQEAASPRGYITHLPPEYFEWNCTTVLTDIFATGVTLFRACNYIDNWDSKVKCIPNLTTLINSGQLIDSLGFAPFIPLKLKKVINKACNPSPDQRYQSALEFRQAIEKIRKNIDWIPTGERSFRGKCIITNAIFSIELIETKTSFNVEVKKNNRKIGTYCKSFNDENSASNYLFSYVSKTLFCNN